MPNKIKRKLPIIRKGPSPKWDIPLRWENIRRNDLKKLSLEISIWNQELFRKTMISFVRLNSLPEYSDKIKAKIYDVTTAERSAWGLFQHDPVRIHHVQLPLRPAINDNK